MERGINVKALIFKGKKEIILYADAIGTSELDSPYISIDTGLAGYSSISRKKRGIILS